MSRQLSRIRNLLSEIEEIQKQGRSKSRAKPPLMTDRSQPSAPVFHAQAAGTPSAVLPPLQNPTDSAAAAPAAIPAYIPPSRITLSLDTNVVVEVCGIVEIKKVAHGLEIHFEDGKAFHIPFKAVA